MQLLRPRIEVSIANQSLTLWDGSRQVAQWPCSTSKFGVGFEEGSFKTPVGAFEITEKIGDEAESGTIFKARQPVGHWQHGGEHAGDEDLVLTRILRLAGREPRNANTHERYVYIHGTNGEDRIGRRASHGCIRLSNRDVIDLFDRITEGTPVFIDV
ncbi:MAG: L,D-transpeptidase [Verrucomicrobiales bacterium]|nr:L,D-transpeptidase [Verrucomicrobiales bacterium]